MGGETFKLWEFRYESQPHTRSLISGLIQSHLVLETDLLGFLPFGEMGRKATSGDIYLDFRVFTRIFCMFPFLLVWPSSRTFLQRHRSIPYLFSPCYLKYCFSIMMKQRTKSSFSTLVYCGGFPRLCYFLKGGCLYL